MQNIKRKINIIGVGETGRNSLPQGILEMIISSPVVMGGERQHEYFPEYQGKRLIIKNAPDHKLADLVETLKQEKKNAVVLASGDPLFFGIGGYLLSQLDDENIEIEIHPSISSMQMAFARAGMSWHDAKCLSLHGRKLQGLAQRVYPENKIAILTDPENHPGKIAAYLIHFNLSNYRAFVAENLGMDNERSSWYDLNELAKKDSGDFLELNVVILIRDTMQGFAKKEYSYGIPDREFSFPEKPDGLITKKEVRTLSISAMNLRRDSVVWDIGSCTGSIAIEAAKIAIEGEVFAIEKNPEHLEHCRLNIKKFHTDIILIEKEAPEGLEDLNAPDAIFIGGSGGRLRKILEIGSRKLRSNGKIVINAATLETLQEASLHLKKQGFIIETTLAQISRNRPVGELTRFQALNPVFILTACRAEGS